jgi:hypothetical protein
LRGHFIDRLSTDIVHLLMIVSVRSLAGLPVGAETSSPGKDTGPPFMIQSGNCWSVGSISSLIRFLTASNLSIAFQIQTLRLIVSDAFDTALGPSVENDSDADADEAAAEHREE